MIGEPRRIGAFDQALQLLEMFAVKLVRRAKVDGNSVLDDPVLFQDRIEDFKRAPTIDHEVLGDDFEPIDDRFLLENMPVVRHPQPDSDSVIRVAVKKVCRHRKWESPGMEPGLSGSDLFGLLVLAVRGAAALAFAGVFPFTALVAGLAATLAFTGILPLTGLCAFIPHGLERDSSLGGCVGCIGADRERPGHEPGHRRSRDECFRCVHLVFWFLAFELLICGRNPPECSKWVRCTPRNRFLTKITLRFAGWSFNFLALPRWIELGSFRWQRVMVLSIGLSRGDFGFLTEKQDVCFG